MHDCTLERIYWGALVSRRFWRIGRFIAPSYLNFAVPMQLRGGLLRPCNQTKFLFNEVMHFKLASYSAFPVGLFVAYQQAGRLRNIGGGFVDLCTTKVANGLAQLASMPIKTVRSACAVVDFAQARIGAFLHEGRRQYGSNYCYFYCLECWQ